MSLHGTHTSVEKYDVSNCMCGSIFKMKRKKESYNMEKTQEEEIRQKNTWRWWLRWYYYTCALLRCICDPLVNHNKCTRSLVKTFTTTHIHFILYHFIYGIPNWSSTTKKVERKNEKKQNQNDSNDTYICERMRNRHISVFSKEEHFSMP